MEFSKIEKMLDAKGDLVLRWKEKGEKIFCNSLLFRKTKYR